MHAYWYTYTHTRLLCTLWGFIDVDGGKWNSVLACIGTMKRNSIICANVQCHAVSVRAFDFGRTSERRENADLYFCYFFSSFKYSMFINSLCRTFLFLSLDFFRFSFTRAYTHTHSRDAYVRMHAFGHNATDKQQPWVVGSHSEFWMNQTLLSEKHWNCVLKCAYGKSTHIYTIIISIWIIRGYFFFSTQWRWISCDACVCEWEWMLTWA